MMIHNPLQLNPEEVCSKIEKFIRANMNKLRRDGVILGLSGGIDSSVVAYLASRAIGSKNVLCLTLPEKHSSTEHLRHAKLIAARLGINHHIESITSKLNTFGIYRMVPGKIPGTLVKTVFAHHMRRAKGSSFSEGLLGPKNKWVARANAFYRIKHRMRMVILYYYAELKNLMVAGATNKTEQMIGLFIKYGCDSAADVMPIAGLFKTQVRQLAEHLGVPKEIIEKPPSADLIPGITDEYVMGLSYETLDMILYGLQSGLPHDQIVDQCNCNPGLVKTVDSWMADSTYKRDTPYFLDFAF